MLITLVTKETFTTQEAKKGADFHKPAPSNIIILRVF